MVGDLKAPGPGLPGRTPERRAVRYSDRTFDTLPGEPVVKKGRHRRYEEARAVKHTSAPIQLDDVGFVPQVEPCPECGSDPGLPHATWCLHDEVEEVEEVD